MRKINIFQTAIYALGYILTFASIGLVNLAIAEWNPSVLETADYWFRVLTTTATYLLAYQLTMNLAADLSGSFNKLYNDTETEIQKIGREQIDGTFADFIADYNLKTKRSVWIAAKMTALATHNTKASDKVISELRLPEEKQGKATRKFLLKQADLKLKLTEPWIKENLPYVHIVYPIVSPAEVVSGVSVDSDKRRLINTDINTHNIRSRSIWLMASIVFNAALNSIILKDQPFNTALVAAIVFQLAILFFNILMGYINGVSAFKHRILNSALKRREILVEFLKAKLSLKS